MPLREEFERSGNWLFQRRSFLPLLAFGPVLVGLHGFHYPNGSHELDLLWELACLAVSLLGFGIRVATVGRVPAGTSGRNTHEGQVARMLNTTGLYSVVRHPLYLGNYLMWLGVALLPRDWWVPVVVSLAFWLYYERIMFAEEEFLRRTFGAEWLEWAARTPGFIPDPRLWRPSTLSFSLRTVLRREPAGLLGLVAAFTFLEIAEDAVSTGALVLDPFWVWGFAGTLVLYGTLLFLKRRTSVLRVRGR